MLPLQVLWIEETAEAFSVNSEMWSCCGRLTSVCLLHRSSVMSWSPADVCSRLSSHCISLCPGNDVNGGNVPRNLESHLHQVRNVSKLSASLKRTFTIANDSWEAGQLVAWLEFNVPFQHKYVYIRDVYIRDEAVWSSDRQVMFVTKKAVDEFTIT